MAKDGRFGKAVVADWPRILRRILPPEFWQRFAQQAPASRDPRADWQPKLLVLCWIFMGWLCAPGLVERFEQARQALVGLFPQRRRPGRSYAGLLKRSRRLKATALQTFLHCLHPTLRPLLGEMWEWFGWIVFAVDGTRVEAPRTRANQGRLRRAGREKTGPQWAVTGLVHLPSRVLWDWRQGPGTDSERAHLRDMLGSLPRGALLLADAGFTGYGLLKALHERPIDFLIRCGSNVRLLLPYMTQSLELSSTGSRLVYLWPEKNRDQPPLVLRLIVITRRGRKMYLLTNVMNRQRMSPSAAAKLYAARWGIELHYRGLKQTLGRRKLLAASPETGAWELAGNLLALALLLVHAVWQQGGVAVRASVAGLWRAVRSGLECLRFKVSSRTVTTALDAAVLDEYQRRRPKRSRDYPRKKREKPPGAPKLRRLTQPQEAMIYRMTPPLTVRLG